MSGGAFDYKCFHFDNFADELEREIRENGKKDEWGCCSNLEEETLAKMKVIVKLCRITGFLAHEAEWLYSGDTGDESFKKRVEEVIPNFDKLTEMLELFKAPKRW